ncbi:MAG TPA: Gfo/Idh/MocA family oxidoreductase [Chthonomonadaceae bacterium]|nr:Gfo/Idh/MocA family oxidoreductase [Chthonomonadaceae bacterium]
MNTSALFLDFASARRVRKGQNPVRVGIIGMGGFAGFHHQEFLTLEKEGACRVVCACDPYPDAFAQQQIDWDFAGRGVRVFSDYRTMLDACRDELDIVTVPTPVPLHAPMHRAVVERGLACYLEKPPTLNYAEMEEMLAVEAQAQKSTQVGFNFIIEPRRQALKRRILSGEFGGVRRIGFYAWWPRPTSYFTRAAWAGRLIMDGKLVLDSCIGNALAHFIHNLHFWAGQEKLYAWEPIASVRAELYRAHAIEGMDTVFAQGKFANGIELQLAATHACAGDHKQWERVECEKATLIYDTRTGYRIEWLDGRREEVAIPWEDLVLQNMRHYLRYVRGEADRPITRLADALPFVQFSDLVYVAAQTITTVPAPPVVRAPAPNDAGETVSIGDESLYATFFATGRFPSQQGLEWARPGGEATLEDLPQLRNTVERMAAERRAEEAGG